MCFFRCLFQGGQAGGTTSTGDGTSGGRSAEDGPEFKSRADEMRHLYRKIVKRLHPDMNPDATQEEKELFIRASEAYQNGDLETLREIASRLDAEGPEEVFENTEEGLEKLRKIVENLKRSVFILKEEIQTIKEAFPYNQKDFLDLALSCTAVNWTCLFPETCWS